MGSQLRSMTGFGAAQGPLSAGRIASVKVSSVNGRFLELSLKVWPRFELDDLEVAVRRVVGKYVERGRVQVAVDLQSAGGQAPAMSFHWEVAEALVEELRRCPDGLDLAPVSLRDLVALPGFADGGAATIEVDERTSLLALVGRACEGLTEAREREARELLPHIEGALAELDTFAAWLRETAAELQPLLIARLRQRLATLIEGTAVPEERLVAEAALLAERADVAEEEQRLSAHLEHFRELVRQGGAMGKKLDFLAQEMLREVNTAASKCREVGMGERVVAAKAALERVREQLANIE